MIGVNFFAYTYMYDRFVDSTFIHKAYWRKKVQNM